MQASLARGPYWSLRRPSTTCTESLVYRAHHLLCACRLNKYILAPTLGGFPYPLTLTSVHMVFCWAVSWLLVKLRVVEVQEMPLETYTRYALCIAADLCHGSAALPKDSLRDAPTSWHANEPERSAQCGQQSASTSGP